MSHQHLCAKCEKRFDCEADDGADCAEFVFKVCEECGSEFDIDLLLEDEPPADGEGD